MYFELTQRFPLWTITSLDTLRFALRPQRQIAAGPRTTVATHLIFLTSRTMNAAFSYFVSPIDFNAYNT